MEQGKAGGDFSGGDGTQPRRDHFDAPSIDLPKGGGAIRSTGEKFAVSPVTGTGSMSVPIATSPGRSGFEPQLSLSYDSGVGNGPFGFGWILPLPSITRKTEKGLPQYLDAQESDVFVLSGAEDLVPVLVKNARDKWEREKLPARTVNGVTYQVDRYRPRIEGLFARIERWTNTVDATDVFWRSISKDNITTWYGKTADSRIADPADQRRIFTWLICQSHDDKGNVIVYGYKAEDSAKVFECSSGKRLTKAHECNRTNQSRSAQRYLKRIRYGNRLPYFPVLKSDVPWPEPPDAGATDGNNAWLFEAVFDYGEHDANAPKPNDAGTWPTRQDPFSSHRATFDVRTYRLCQRVLMFHHFPGENGVESDCLVRSTDFTYSDEVDPTDVHDAVYTFLKAVTLTGYRRNNGGYNRRSLPPVEFEYTEPLVQQVVEEVDRASLENLPVGLDGSAYSWIDLHGEGIPGILTERGGAWFYKRNLSPLADTAQFASLEAVALKPNLTLSGGAEIIDLAGDGQPDVVVMEGPTPGLYKHDEAEGWQPFRPFTSRLNRDLRDPNLKFVDLDGDGHADVLITEDYAFVWHASLAEEGFGPARCVARALDEEKGPRIVFADETQSIYLADLSGDGLTDIARIRNGEVCYWPNLGYGRFGAKVAMDNAPWFDHPDQFDHERIRLADIDGSGTTDIIYLHRDGVRLYFNQSGNGWSRPHAMKVFPRIDDLVSIVPTDLLGNGTACLVWSSPLPGDARRPMRYVNLMGGCKPHLLVKTVNNLGAETRIDYAPSTKFYLQDKRDGKPWVTRLPFPVHVVERVETQDLVSGTRFVRSFAYHHGYFDSDEREFRGFGMVEQVDTEGFVDYLAGVEAIDGSQAVEANLYQPPITTRTWFHTGAYLEYDRLRHRYQREYYSHTSHLPEPMLASGLDTEEMRECVRALKGLQVRQEIYSLDGSAAETHPYTVTEQTYEVRCVQHRGGQRHGVFLALGGESVAINYERDSSDPRIVHTVAVELDEYGNARKSCSLAYGRQQSDPVLPPEVARDQKQLLVTYTEVDYTPDLEHTIPVDAYRMRVPYETRDYEITGLVPAKSLFRSDELQTGIADAEAIGYEVIADGVTRQKRLLSRSRTTFLDNSLKPLPAGQWDTLGQSHCSYVLAFTPAIANAYFAGQVNDDEFASAGYVHLDGDANWWIPSGTAIYPPDPMAAFYHAIGVKDPFGIETLATYDRYSLLIEKVELRQAAWNVSSAHNDYRVLGPVLMTDPNGNRTAVAHDEVGMVVKTAVMGKANSGEGDTLADPTTRVEYDLFNWMHNRQPNFARSFAREQHGAVNPRWQESYVYSNGSGGVALAKAQAHPGKALQVQPDGTAIEVDADPRWVGSGRTVVNNKGKPVKQYEPYFSTTHNYEDASSLRELGVTPILTYDPMGRNIRTDFPNGTFTTVEFTPWQQKVFDANDSVRRSRWYVDRGSPDPGESEPANDPERRAAWLAAKHADTPGVTYFNSLGRRVYALTDFGGGKTAAVRSEVDLTGRSTRIFDALGREVSSGLAAMAGIPVVGSSAEKGRRWILHDVLGAMVRSWDEHGLELRGAYDHLHRPVGTFVRQAGGNEVLHNYIVYGDRLADAAPLNLLGTTYLMYDQSGLVRVPEVDFKGNPKSVERVLAKDYKQTIDWRMLTEQVDVAAIEAAANPALETIEVFTVRSRYDALNRPTQVILPEGTEIIPTYSQANFLSSLSARIRGKGPPVDFLADQDFDAKGQRQLLRYGNGVLTRFFYDPRTFRLTNLLTLKSATSAPADALQNLNYCYDPVGNLTQIRDDAQQVNYFNNAVVKSENLYEYDAAYQLIRATGRELAGLGNDSQRTYTDLGFAQLPQANNTNAVRKYTEEYEYDLLGNLKTFRHRYQPQQMIGGGWTRRYRYAYDEAAGDRTNRLISTSMPGDSKAGPFSATYSYDVYGNMTRMSHLASMDWDVMDRLRRVDLGGGGTAWYVYDGDGQRIRKITERGGNLRVERTYLGCIEIYRERTSDRAPHLERYTLHVVDAGMRLAQVDIKTRDQYNNDPDNPLDVPLIRYQHGNHAGSAVLETDRAGSVISYEEYHPFGTSAYRSSKPGANLSLKRMRFSGKELDDETGLYHFGARYYAPWLGRWTSSDPGGFVDGTNLFRYCRNSPVMIQDPNGLEVTYLPGSTQDRLTPESTLADRQAFAARHGRQIVDPNPEQQSWIGSPERGHWQLSPEGRFEPLPGNTKDSSVSPPITTDSAATSKVEVTIEPGATADSNPGTDGVSGGSSSTDSTSRSDNPESSGGGGGGSGERSFFTSSFFRGLAVGLAVTVAVVAVVATGGAALAVIAPGASAAIAASGVGTALAVAGTAVTVANTVQSVRQRDLRNNPISEEEANYNLGLGLGAAAGGALARPAAQIGAGLGTSLGRGTTAAMAAMGEALEGGTLATSMGATWGNAVAAPVVSGVSTTTAATIAGTSMGTTTMLMRGHTASWELRGPDGRIETRGRLSSGSDKPPGRRLSWNEQLQTHTERKILDMLRGRVQPGDHVTIRGTKPPCDPGGRGCGSAMQAFAEQMNIRISYTNTTTGQIWRYP